MTISVSASGGATVAFGPSLATAFINGVPVGSSCSGVYDLTNPPTTGCLAGTGLHIGNNNLTVTDQYLAFTGAFIPCPGTSYSLCYSYFGSAPSPTVTPSDTPTNTPMGTLTPS
ncbi:MAG TPA: hypothetical protein VIJ93_02430, partial [bacterium]